MGFDENFMEIAKKVTEMMDQKNAMENRDLKLEIKSLKKLLEEKDRRILELEDLLEINGYTVTVYKQECEHLRTIIGNKCVKGDGT